ncbi:uncharacterized protein C2845_PM11G18390 [Panicum miliaceum]|uniref:Uncharacterized protein n=1 Tax=Panicum miliaceum TaxID=4540 RepID=A0A3L6RVV9_PANMI|nr:uncharacterized protein C2845_PM11G18390 [Panicum miliaceum]
MLHQQDRDPAYKVFDNEHIDLTKPGAAHLAHTSPEAASGPHGHGDATSHRGSGYGVVTTLQPPPVTALKNIGAFSETAMKLMIGLL